MAKGLSSRSAEYHGGNTECAACGDKFSKSAGNYSTYVIASSQFHVCGPCREANIEKLIGKAVQKVIDAQSAAGSVKTKKRG